MAVNKVQEQVLLGTLGSPPHSEFLTQQVLVLFRTFLEYGFRLNRMLPADGTECACRLQLRPSSPAALTASVNDYNPLDSAEGERFIVNRLTTDGAGPYDITGIERTAAPDVESELILLLNIHTSDTINLRRLNAGSAAANQIDTGVGTPDPLAIAPGQARALWYDDASSVWRVLW